MKKSRFADRRFEYGLHLPGSRVMAVVNFPPRQIGPVKSEVLVLGFPDDSGAIVLARPDLDAPDGARLA